MKKNKKLHIIGGATLEDGNSLDQQGHTAKQLYEKCIKKFSNLDSILSLTKIANLQRGELESNQDLKELAEDITEDLSTKIVFFTSTIVDYSNYVINTKKEEETQNNIIDIIRKSRKDIFLVGVHNTSGLSEDEQYIEGLHFLKGSSANLVLSDDVKTQTRMIITPEEARYHVTQDKQEALDNLVDMAFLRSQLTFTRSTVVAGESIEWDSDLIPTNMKEVVNHCISKGAYKPFRGSTVGHFAFKINERTFATSRRKTNFNDLNRYGLVKIETDGPDSVIAYGSKPSVGGQSQRIVFNKNENLDCIVHFHSPIREGSEVTRVSQRNYECGSHECGQNTANGLKKFDDIYAVYLENHGPNIVFSKDTPADDVIDFIEANFDLEGKTGGVVDLAQIQ